MDENLLNDFKNFDIYCFSIFNNYYIFCVSSQTAITVSKETWETVNALSHNKINDLSILPEKTKVFLNKLITTKVIEKKVNLIAPSFDYDLHMLSLVHTQRCNLNCRYCFAKEKDKKFDMSIETAKKAIDFFVKVIAPSSKSYSIDLTGAGEPIVNRKFIVEICEYITKLRETGIKINPSFITNGMLLTEEWIDIILHHKISWALSLDGTKEKTELVRSGADYQKIINNYLKVKNKTSWQHYGIRCTYNSENCDFIETFESLYRLGFGYSISMNPARTKEGDFGNINQKNVETVLNNYEDFCNYLLELSLKPDIGRINAYFSGQSYFQKYIIGVLGKTKTFYRCSAGRQNVAVNYEGDFFICTAMSGQKEAYLGNINTGFDYDLQNKLKEIYADNVENCKECWARYNCAGTCMAESLYVNNNLQGAIPIKCQINKHLLKLAIYFCHQLLIKKPDILDYIKNKTKR